MVEELEFLPGYKLLLNIESIEPDTNSIIPRLRIYVDIRYSIGVGRQNKRISITLLSSRLFIVMSTKSLMKRNIHVGTAYPDNHIISFSAGGKSTLIIYADLDPYKLAKIEEWRQGDDLIIQIEPYIVIEDVNNPSEKRQLHPYLEKRISKSDWVENFLGSFEFKKTFMIELPAIIEKDFSKIIEALDKAWKYYYLGDPKETLVYCRQAMEGLATLVKEYGYETKEVDNKGKEKSVPNWEKLIGKKKTAEIIKSFMINNRNFTSPAAHYGKMISKEDAELALMVTYGLINYVEKTLRKVGKGTTV